MSNLVLNRNSFWYFKEYLVFLDIKLLSLAIDLDIASKGVNENNSNSNIISTNRNTRTIEYFDIEEDNDFDNFIIYFTFNNDLANKKY